MDPIRERAALDLLAELLEMPRARRGPALASRCPDDEPLRVRVEQLLAVAAAGEDPLEPTLGDRLRQQADARARYVPGGRIGGYLLLRPLARGGSSLVFEAVPVGDPEGTPVALKLLEPRSDWPSLATRFSVEYRALAALDHPGIARLLDHGMARDGTPYLVTELVSGLPITDDCDRSRLGIRDRLRCFLPVCEATEHAHRHLIVHRDLKPSNILVDADGHPKLLDFGISKLLDPASADEGRSTVAVLLTPGYASPEQLAGEPVTTASDVYSLGVILYELLSGRLPFEHSGGSRDEYGRRMRIEAVVPPSATFDTARGNGSGSDAAKRAAARGAPAAALRRELRGDPDVIVRKALRPEVSHRYGSVPELAADIESYLAGFPVRARPPSPAYRLRKFVRRNAALVAAAIAALTVVLVFAWQSIRHAGELERERDVARQERRRAEEIVDFFTASLRQAESPQPGGEATVKEAIAASVDRIDELAAQPDLQAALLGTVGWVQAGLGYYDDAVRHLDRAVTMNRDLDDQSRLVESLQQAGEVHTALADYEPAAILLGEALELNRRLAGVRSQQAASSLHSLSLLHKSRGDLDAAHATASQALAIRRELFGEWHPSVVESLTQLASVERWQGRSAEAERRLRHAAVLARAVLPRQHELTITLNDLALLLQSKGNYDEAEDLLQEVLDIRRRELGPHHPHVLHAFNNLGSLLHASGDYEGAESALRASLEGRLGILGAGHPELASSRNNLAALLQDMGRFEEAEALYRDSLAALRATLGEDHLWVALIINNLGWLLQEKGAYDESSVLLEDAAHRLQALYGESHPYIALSLNNRAWLALKQHRLAEAEAGFDQALAMRRRLLGSDHTDTADTLAKLGHLRYLQRRYEEAAALASEARAVYRRQLPAGDWRTAWSEAVLGAAFAATGRADEGLELLSPAAKTLRAARSDRAYEWRWTQARLADVDAGGAARELDL